MDVLKISNTKIKIMMTPEDVKTFGLNASDTDYNDKSTKTKVWHILEYLKSTHDFEHGKDKLLIQFYPSKDGGAELFITKLVGLSKTKERALSVAENLTVMNSRKRIYNFKNLSELIRAAKIINGKSCVKESDLFFSENDGYFLGITEEGTSRLDVISELAVMLEFSDRIANEKSAYIAEHFKKITDSKAVELLAKL